MWCSWGESLWGFLVVHKGVQECSQPMGDFHTIRSHPAPGPLLTLTSLSSQLLSSPQICATLPVSPGFPSQILVDNLPPQLVLPYSLHLGCSGAECKRPKGEAWMLQAPPGAVLLSDCGRLPGGQLVCSATQSSPRYLAQSLSY